MCACVCFSRISIVSIFFINNIQTSSFQTLYGVRKQRNKKHLLLLLQSCRGIVFRTQDVCAGLQFYTVKLVSLTAGTKWAKRKVGCELGISRSNFTVFWPFCVLGYRSDDNVYKVWKTRWIRFPFPVNKCRWLLLLLFLLITCPMWDE